MTKNSIILSIDTSKTQVIRLALCKESEKNEGMIEHISASEEILSVLEQLLKKCGVNKNDIDEIRVVTGPGSFTGIRVGVLIAQILGVFLQIPVNGKSPELPISIIYENDRWG